MFNYRMSNSPDAYRNIFATQPAITSGSSSLFKPLPSTATSALTTSLLGTSRTSPLPKRRYSIGGLPTSTSVADYLNLPIQETAANANLSNLLSETYKSISRSSNILNRRLSYEMALDNANLTNIIDDNINSDIIKYDLINNLTTTATLTPTKYSNYYSQPAIGTEHLLGTSATPLAPTSFYTNSYQPTRNTSLNLYPSNRLMSDDYLLSKPIFSKNYDTLPLASSYLTDDCYTRPFNALSTHTSRLLTQTHSSNPCLSQTQFNPYSTALNRSTYYPLPTRQPSSSSLNRYTYNAPSFYHRPSSRLDLDTNKSNDIKRQVSFKFDVDEMSFDP